MGRDIEKVGRFNLITGEETFAGQFAQNPTTARRLQSLIPSLNGELKREAGETLYLPTNLGAKVGNLIQYSYNDTGGLEHKVWFAATATGLWKNTGAAWTLQSLPLNTGFNSTTPFTDYPDFENINNLLHFSDGVTNWIYDGPNNQFVIEGFALPFTAPGIISSATAGLINATIGKYYWYTYADETTGRVHESSSGLISGTTGALVNKQVTITPMAGNVTTVLGSPSVTISSSTSQSWIGMHLYVLGTDYGVITAASGAGPGTLTLASNAPANNSNVAFLIAPVRATHIHFYGSETDGSKLGKFHGKMLVTANPPTFTDNSPFQNQAGSTILNIERPVRNDPPPASKILEVHKYRIFRHRETIPNRFTYSANEEVASGANGSPQESVPGTDPNTLSDIINETAYPRPAASIRALKSHADALYLGTEKEIIPLYGETIGQFIMSEVTEVDGGVISRWGMESSSHGLIIFSYDRKLYVYPPFTLAYNLNPDNINETDALQEIGRSMRNKFLTILATDIQNVRVKKYKYNTRDWLVVCYQDNNNVYHTYIYDFETKGWFELQRGFVSVEVFEPSPGVKVLVGGGSDGLVYVADDVTGAFAPNTTFPTALYRTALIDFGQPDMLHVPDYLQIEVSNAALMDQTTTINFYLDPLDADNPGTPFQLSMSAVQGQPNTYRGFFAAAEGGMGVICRRLMIEFNLASDTNAGSFRGIVLKSDPIPDTVL